MLPQPAEDPVDDLLAECLRADDPASAVADATRDHPEQAIELRRRWEFLLAAGAPGITPPAAAPSRLGRFRLIEKIGGGGMGVVYRAIEDPPGREVALKLVRPEHLWFEGAQKRFLREMQIIATMQHPGIVPVYSCGEQDGVPYCAMECVPGRSLAELLAELRRGGAPPSPTALHQDGARTWTDACFRVVLQVAEALAHVHERSVVHRDVKPSNILLEASGRARLIDFGLARGGSSESLTRTGVQPGSLAYMSPEQVRGDEVDARTDVWSLGVTLLELITLHQPYLAANEELTRRAILSGTRTEATRLSSRMPWDAATVIGTAMAPELERRYRTMQAFAADLRAFLDRRPIAARRAGPVLRLRRWVERRPAAAAVIALLVAVLGVLPTTLLLRERANRQTIEKEAERARTAEQASTREAATARRVVQFLQDLFYEVDPSRARGETVPARVVLDRGVHRIRTELTDEPQVRVALLQAMGIVYLNLGLIAQSEELLQECVRVGEQDPHTNPAQLQNARRELARVHMHQGRNAEAERLARALLAAQPDATLARAMTLLVLADATMRQDRTGEARLLYDEALAILQATPDSEQLLLGARRRRAEMVLERIDPQQALAELRDVHRAMQQQLTDHDPGLVWATYSLAAAEQENGNPAAALALLEPAIANAVKVFDKLHPAIAALRESLAEAQMQLERPDDALRQLDLALEAYLATYPRPHYVIARAFNLESSLAYETADFARAERAARKALQEFESLANRSSHDYAMALGNLSRVLLMLGNWSEAQELATQAVTLLKALEQKRPELLAYNEIYLAYSLALLGVADAKQHAAAARQLVADSRDRRARGNVHCYAAEVALLANRSDEALELARLAEQDWSSFGSERGADWARFVQGWAENSRGNAAEAERILRASLARQQANYRAGHPYIARTAVELAVALCRQKKLDEGITLLQQAVTALRDNFGPDSRMLPLPLLNLGMAQFRRERAAEASTHGIEALRILGRHSAKSDRLLEPGLRLVMAALPGIEDPGARRKGWLALREAAAKLLPADHQHLGTIDKALAEGR